MPALDCPDSQREAARWRGRGLATSPRHGHPGRLRRWKHEIVTPSRVTENLSQNPLRKHFHLLQIRSCSPERRLGWCCPDPLGTQRNWVSQKLTAWLKVTHLHLTKFLMDIDHQSWGRGQEKLYCLDSSQKTLTIFKIITFFLETKNSVYYICNYYSNF